MLKEKRKLIIIIAEWQFFEIMQHFLYFLATWRRHRDLSSREVSFIDIDSGVMVHFFPPSIFSTWRGSTSSHLCFYRLSGWSARNKGPLSFLSQRSLSVRIWLSKVGLKGILSQSMVGVCGANRLYQAANIRHNDAWHSAEVKFKKRKHQRSQWDNR